MAIELVARLRTVRWNDGASSRRKRYAPVSADMRGCRFFCHFDRSAQRERSGKISDGFALAKQVPVSESAQCSFSADPEIGFSVSFGAVHRTSGRDRRLSSGAERRSSLSAPLEGAMMNPTKNRSSLDSIFL
jgi:hypothetical protein